LPHAHASIGQAHSLCLRPRIPLSDGGHAFTLKDREIDDEGCRHAAEKSIGIDQLACTHSIYCASIDYFTGTLLLELGTDRRTVSLEISAWRRFTDEKKRRWCAHADGKTDQNGHGVIGLHGRWRATRFLPRAGYRPGSSYDSDHRDGRRSGSAHDGITRERQTAPSATAGSWRPRRTATTDTESGPSIVDSSRDRNFNQPFTPVPLGQQRPRGST
jgi:hypothetical protein